MRGRSLALWFRPRVASTPRAEAATGELAGGQPASLGTLASWILSLYAPGVDLHEPQCSILANLFLYKSSIETQGVTGTSPTRTSPPPGKAPSPAEAARSARAVAGPSTARRLPGPHVPKPPRARPVPRSSLPPRTPPATAWRCP